MLVVLYIISAVSGVYVALSIEEKNYKDWFISTLTAVLTGIAFCVLKINKIVTNMADINFWSVFAVTSLIAWQITFLFNNRQNLVINEIAFALLAFTIYSMCYYSEREVCTDPHKTIEVISLMTTIDDSEAEESVYGDGFIVRKVYSSYSSYIYQYYYQLEDGTPVEDNIPVYATEIIYISPDSSPFIEIITIRECSGYYPKTDNHSLGFAKKTYKLYIPENSILNATSINPST